VSRARLAHFWQSAAALDRDWSGRMRIREGRRWARLGALIVAHLGDSPLWAVVSAIAYWLGDGRLRSAVILMAVAVVITATIGAGIKVLVRRPRPGGYATWLYSRRMDQHSFPSGHAARGGAVAATISAVYPPLWPIALAYALGVAAARVALGVHFLGDVVFGMLLGALVGVGCVVALAPLLAL
jgi:undecaprenyl-diphosphatase